MKDFTPAITPFIYGDIDYTNSQVVWKGVALARKDGVVKNLQFLDELKDSLNDLNLQELAMVSGLVSLIKMERITERSGK